MNRLLPLSVLSVALLAAPGSHDAMATTGIMKCATPGGLTVYTDQACTSGSRAVPISSQMLTRIAHDEARWGNGIDGLENATPPVRERRAVAAGCARSLAQLQMDLRASITLGDVNRLAESYHWVGLSTREGERVLDRLQRLTREPVVDAHYFDAAISSSPLGTDAIELAAAGSGPGSAGMLQLQLGSGSGVSVVDMDVERYAGCYFVKF